MYYLLQLTMPCHKTPLKLHPRSDVVGCIIFFLIIETSHTVICRISSRSKASQSFRKDIYRGESESCAPPIPTARVPDGLILRPVKQRSLCISHHCQAKSFASFRSLKAGIASLSPLLFLPGIEHGLLWPPPSKHNRLRPSPTVAQS